jgi:AcrR family transcriptional regulator
MPVRHNASTFRTRRRIHDAFMTLVESRDVADISVNDVTNAAHLNRTTFYLHYPDIHALLDAVIEELTSRQQEGGRRLLEWDPSQGDTWQETFFGTIAERPHIFLSLLRSTAREKLAGKLMRDHEAFFLAQWRKDGITSGPGGVDLRLCATFVAGGVHALTVDWLENGMPVDPVTISEQAYQLGMAVIASQEVARLPLAHRDSGN